MEAKKIMIFLGAEYPNWVVATLTVASQKNNTMGLSPLIRKPFAAKRSPLALRNFFRIKVCQLTAFNKQIVQSEKQ